MPCSNSNSSQISDFIPIVNGQEDIHLLGNFLHHRQLCALGKRQRGRLEHHGTRFHPPQQNSRRWWLGAWVSERKAGCSRDLREETCLGGLTQKATVPRTLGNNHRFSTALGSKAHRLFCDIEKTPALDWHKAEQFMQETWQQETLNPREAKHKPGAHVRQQLLS